MKQKRIITLAILGLTLTLLLSCTDNQALDFPSEEQRLYILRVPMQNHARSSEVINIGVF